MMPGSNGHTKPPTNGHVLHAEARAAIAELEIAAIEKPRPCCARIANQSWCYLNDGHEGEHTGPAPVHGPLEARPKIWRDRRGKI